MAYCWVSELEYSAKTKNEKEKASTNRRPSFQIHTIPKGATSTHFQVNKQRHWWSPNIFWSSDYNFLKEWMCTGEQNKWKTEKIIIILILKSNKNHCIVEPSKTNLCSLLFNENLSENLFDTWVQFWSYSPLSLLSSSSHVYSSHHSQSTLL